MGKIYRAFIKRLRYAIRVKIHLDKGDLGRSLRVHSRENRYQSLAKYWEIPPTPLSKGGLRDLFMQEVYYF